MNPQRFFAQRFFRRILVIFLAAMSLAGAVGAAAETVNGNGVMRTQERPAAGFSGVALGIPAKLEVKISDNEGVTIEADENLLALIETTVVRGSLDIKPSRRNLNLQSKAIRIVVRAKQVDRLAIGGSGSISAADAIKGRQLKLDIGGSGEIDVRSAETERVSVAIGGSGDVKVAGAAQRLNITIGGSGNVDAGSLLAQDAEVTIAGNGDASVAAQSSLNVTIAGSGDVSFRGDPSVKKTVIGSGSIKRAGPLPR